MGAGGAEGSGPSMERSRSAELMLSCRSSSAPALAYSTESGSRLSPYPSLSKSRVVN